MSRALFLLLLMWPWSLFAEQSMDIVPSIVPSPDIIPVDTSADKAKGAKSDDHPQDTKEITKIDTESHWGVAAGGALMPDYPGSDSSHLHYMIIPTYKGKHLTIDRQDGVRGELTDQNIFKFSLSFIFMFPASSDKIDVRHGMPDLDWTFQLGPEAQIYLHRSFYHTMFIKIPLRFIATTDFSHNFEYRDWNLAPGLRNIFYLGKGRGEITTRLDFDIAAERYNDLFFQVDPRYATPTRPTYNARGGLMEYILGVNYSYYDSFPWTYFIGVNAYSTSVSVNRDSPLIVRDWNFSVIGGVIRYF